MRAARRRGEGADGVEPLVDVADAVKLARLLGLRQQHAALAIGGEHRVQWSRGAARRLLRQIADARVARRLDRAAIRFDHPGDELQERRFAGAVAANETDAAAPDGNRRRGLVEHELVAETQGEPGQCQHRPGDSKPRARCQRAAASLSGIEGTAKDGGPETADGRI